MMLSHLVVILALATGSQGIVLRGRAESLEVSESSEWAALDQAEAADRSFLLAQLSDTESQLLKLQQFVAPEAKKAEGKAPQATKDAATAAKKDTPPAPAAKKAAPVAKKEKEESPEDMLKSLGMPKMPDIKGAMGKAALAPMLGMLKGLYDESKERISQQNAREEKSKKWFAEKETEHKAKLSSIEGKFANHTLSEEFRTNETRDETRYFKYWQGCRERQHRQFHTNLKIQHGMMNKVKKMIDMYEKALSSKPEDQKAAKKQLGQMTGMPEIVFLQSAVSSFCADSLEEVHKERAELQEAAKEVNTY